MPTIFRLRSLTLARPAFAGLLCMALAQPGAADNTITIPDTTAQRALACSRCHAQQDRQVANEYFPRLASKPAAYLFKQLQNFRDGRRQHPMMMHMVSNLPEPYLQELAQYFSAQKPQFLPLQASGASDATQLAQGKKLVLEGDAGKKVPACIACHGEKMYGRQPAIPGLIGLPRDYVNAQLGAWKNGSRKTAAPDCMAQIANRLSDTDISAISAWLATQNVPQAADAAGSLAHAPQQADGKPLPLACDNKGGQS